MFVTLAMVVGVDSMAPVNSIQADWLDVKDFGCVGVNNCNTETCTSTSAAETSVDQTSINNTGNSTCQISSTLTLTPNCTFHMYSREAEVDETDTIPPTTEE